MTLAATLASGKGNPPGSYTRVSQPCYFNSRSISRAVNPEDERSRSAPYNNRIQGGVSLGSGIILYSDRA